MSQQINIDGTWYQVPDEVAKRMGEYYDTMKVAVKDREEIIATVTKVREKQKLYFKTKAYNILEESKAAERELDDILSGKSKVEQPSLF